MARNSPHAPRVVPLNTSAVPPPYPDPVVPKTSEAMKIIAVTNIKGGVGKTTTAVNLSFLCAAGGRPTLLWDLDPQGAATYTLRGEPVERASPKKLPSGKRPDTRVWISCRPISPTAILTFT